MVRCTLWAMGAVLVPTSAVLPSHPMRPDGGAPGLYAQYDWPVPKGISNDMRVDHTVSPSPRALTQCSKQFKSCSSHDTCSGTRKSTASFRRCCPSFALSRGALSLFRHRIPSGSSSRRAKTRMATVCLRRPSTGTRRMISRVQTTVIME